MVNEAGQVAFIATVIDDVHGRHERVYVGTSELIEPIATQFTPAPDGGNFYFFQQAVLNNAGQVAFRCGLIGGTSTEGVFVGTSAGVQTVAIDNAPAPIGGTYTFFRENIAFNDSGQVAFTAGVQPGDLHGLFVGPPGAIQPHAMSGQAAPGGGNYGSFVLPALNRFGQVAFKASLVAGDSNEGLFLSSDGFVETVALANTSAPAGGVISELTPIRGLNGAGEVTFFANLTGGSSLGGFFAGTPGSLQTVALHGSPSPVGGTYFSFGGGAPISFNESSDVAFNAALSGGMFIEGSFFGKPGSLMPVALAGAPSPDGLILASVSAPAINSSGQLLVYAGLSGTVPASNNVLYGGIAGRLYKIVREGDQIDVDPGPDTDLRTVANSGIDFNDRSGGDDGHSSALSDSGYVALKLNFTDGTSGIFLYKLAPIPEPSSSILAFIGLSLTATAYCRVWRPFMLNRTSAHDKECSAMAATLSQVA
jgi:hypothetical protein